MSSVHREAPCSALSRNNNLPNNPRDATTLPPLRFKLEFAALKTDG
jgi:hypothetical protein